MARRYLTLLWVQLRASAARAMHYRLDFVLDTVLSVFWTATAVVPLLVLFRQRATVAGWTRDEALVVVAWFTCLKGVIHAVIEPSLTTVVEHVRKGTLDFVLLKPADAEFLVSTSNMTPWKGADTLGGLALLGVALRALHHTPTALEVAATAALLVGATVILHSLWILVVSLAFVVVKVDNLSFLLGSLYDAARWPGSVFRGALGVVFTFVIPLTVMTTYPALAILGRLDGARFVGALAGAALSALVARRAWTGALSRYTSAGG